VRNPKSKCLDSDYRNHLKHKDLMHDFEDVPDGDSWAMLLLLELWVKGKYF